MPGIKAILVTGKVSIEATPIGADTDMITVMTGIFIISTIVARAAVGIKASMVGLPLINGTRIKVMVTTMINEALAVVRNLMDEARVLQDRNCPCS